MAVDIRATVTCSLGTLISASISDDYIQGSGLIKTKGNCELSGLYNPPTGTVVTFAYTKGGVTRAVPRKLRVLSSFADPFRRTTRVELGCKLTYLQDLQDRLSWDAFDDPLNAELTEEEAEIITFPISASSVMAECLIKLGISASSIPLSNRFSVAEFDFSPGYVNILSDLLVSESYCGYLDYRETLQVFSLSSPPTGGPIIDSSRLIDVGPVNFGQLPGDAVTVSFSSLRLKASVDPEEVEDPNTPPVVESPPTDPDELEEYQEAQQRRNWELTRNVGAPALVALRFTDAIGTKTYTYTPVSTIETSYAVVNGTEQVSRQTEITNSIAAADFGNYLVALITAGAPVEVNGAVPTQSTTITTYSYSGNTVTTTREEFIPFATAFGAMNLPYAFGPDDYILVPETPIKVRMTVARQETVGRISRTVTTFYKLWHETIEGQQAIAEGGQNFANSSQVAAYVNAIVKTGPVFAGTEISTQQVGGGSLPPARPSSADLINQSQADAPEDASDDPFVPDYSTPSVAELVLAQGSSLAERRIELSMPYAPDDRFVRGARIGTDEPPRYKYFAVRSDARSKAARFGRAQNRILLGNRYGISIQVDPVALPNAPFAPFYVSANGTVSQYRTNGTSWTMDSNGIVASTDALYWGVVGQAP
jgi:hypothetical protein